MLKQINWKLLALCFTWMVCITGLVILVGFIEIRKRGERCTNVKIIVPGTQSFVESAEVFRMLTEAGGKLKGSLLASINTQVLERTLKANPYIENAKVYTDLDGVLWVRIEQREPILRIVNQLGQDFYIDKKSMKIPSSVNFTARVLVANGFIAEAFNGKVDTLTTPLAKDLLTVSRFIQRDSLWNDQIVQLYVNNRGEIEMIPLVGNQRIILGNAEMLEQKFRNLLAFYKKAIPAVGWTAYKTINIKYAGQVVCEKADSLGAKAPILDSIPLSDSTHHSNNATDTVKTLIQ